MEGIAVGAIAGILPQIGQSAQHIPAASKEVAGLAFGVIVSSIDIIRDAWQEAFEEEADICFNSNVGAPAIGGPLPTIENFFLIQQLINDLEKDPNNKAAIDAAKQIKEEWKNQLQVRQ